MLLVIALTSACTSAVAIGTVYNSAASRFSKEMLSYAEFNSRQQKDIRHRVSAFHQWHRESQLSQYGELMRQIALGLQTPQQLNSATVVGWTESLRGFSQNFSSCNPLNQSGALLRGLSDRQVRQVTTRIQEKHTQRVREYESRTAQQRFQERIKTIEKWARRAGINLTGEQQDLLKSTLEKQISLSPQRHELWQTWSDKLIYLLKDRHHSESEQAINRHIDSLWRLTEKNYPREWQTNIDLWQDFASRFLSVAPAEQTSALADVLSRIANSLAKLQTKPKKTEAICFAGMQ